MNKVVTVLDNQSIWDMAIQEYGSFEGVKQLMIDNPTKCNFETSLAIGTLLVITQKPMNQRIYDTIKTKNIIPATAIESPIISGWILDNGIWNDNKWWNDNAWWID